MVPEGFRASYQHLCVDATSRQFVNHRVRALYENGEPPKNPKVGAKLARVAQDAPGSSANPILLSASPGRAGSGSY